MAGAPCRIMRVGFVGELGYEIHLPAEHAVDVWRALLVSDSPSRVKPFGVEAQRMLRLEKGHFIVGQDTDGVTNALEIDMPWALKMDKPFFVGQRSLRILEKLPRRQTLVGFTLPQPSPGQTQRRRKSVTSFWTAPRLRVESRVSAGRRPWLAVSVSRSSRPRSRQGNS